MCTQNNRTNSLPNDQSSLLVKKRLQKQKGLTLVELVIVMVILGVLMAAMANTMTGSTNKATATSIDSNISNFVDNWVVLNANAGTSSALDDTGSSSFINSSGGVITPQSTGIDGSANDRNGMLDLVVNGALTEDASGNLQIEFIPDGTVMVNESTDAAAASRVDAFQGSGLIPLSNSINYDADTGQYNIEGIAIANVYSPNRSALRVVFADVPLEICEALEKRNPSSRIFSGTDNGGTTGDLAGQVDGCGTNAVIDFMAINLYI